MYGAPEERLGLQQLHQLVEDAQVREARGETICQLSQMISRQISQEPSRGETSGEPGSVGALDSGELGRMCTQLMYLIARGMLAKALAFCAHTGMHLDLSSSLFPPLLRALSPAPHPPPRAEKTCVDSGKSRRPACGISQHTHGISSHTHEPSHKSQAREPSTRACVLLTRCTDTETRDQEEVGADVGGEQGSTDDSEEADDAVVLLQWAASIGKQHTIYICVCIYSGPRP